MPFHGYYFRILEAEGGAAPGGAASYVVNGATTGGFALIAWPVHYDASGVMTFIVGKDGVVSKKDLGPDTAKAAIAHFVPDPTWQRVQPTDSRPRPHGRSLVLSATSSGSTRASGPRTTLGPA